MIEPFALDMVLLVIVGVWHERVGVHEVKANHGFECFEVVAVQFQDVRDWVKPTKNARRPLEVRKVIWIWKKDNILSCRQFVAQDVHDFLALTGALET